MIISVYSFKFIFFVGYAQIAFVFSILLFPLHQEESLQFVS